MNDWTTSTEHPGYRCKVIKRNNYTVTVLRPELKQAERVKQEDHVRAVTERTIKNYLIRKEKIT